MAKKTTKAKRTTSVRSSLTKKNLLIALVGLVVGVGGTILTQASFAAPPNKGGGGSYSGTVTGPVLVTDTNSNGVANWGDTITFSVNSNYTANSAGPWVDMYCYQNGAFVYSQTAGFGPDYPWAANYTLSSAYWTSGPANCTATLYYNAKNGRHVDMSTLKFDVAG